MADDEQVGSLADDIVPIQQYEAASPAKKSFLPWHKPRKQFVRQEQWSAEIRDLFDADDTEGALRYLGLPGSDLLDLRYFHSEICEPRGIGLRFLGFNSAAKPASSEQTELNISLDEVRHMPGVDPKSEVLGDDFVLVANDSSIAWQKSRALGPFDVVNVDLCDGFGSAAPDSLPETYYDALAKLMSLQARRKAPWLLFITTRTGPDHIDPEVLEKLLATYLENLVGCEAFREQSARECAANDDETLRAATSTPAGLLPIYLCSLAKWVARLAMKQTPSTSVELRSVIGYKVFAKAEELDLFSIALRLSPNFSSIEDETGLAKSNATPDDECATAVQLLERVGQRVDADRLIGEDPDLLAALIDATANLLERARYDPIAYRDWVGAGT